ncbi:hypothetical protein ACFOQM_00105 [Paenibacillus sp. GCM10012307]|uniref:Uncharacterized protein n=1 Tax=Paenibacillus roseus TaxID=2798579 RepID=A0A934IUT5_9BACL|nr:hypothetical protein [Paenibacillus roseus]MBJ6359731.1 hypothetical protein [Paenibacillus roseus]
MTVQEKVRLSQWDALLLEGLRATGLSNEEMLSKIKTGELPQDESDFHFDYQVLAQLAAQDSRLVERAILEGYQIKYNTVGGINSWIRVALGKPAEISREEGNSGVTASLQESERKQLESVLSYGWKIVDLSEGTCRIVPLSQEK